MLTRHGEKRRSVGRIYDLDAITGSCLTLADGELAFGTPIVWDEFSPPDPWLGSHELYVPTYDRYVAFFSHGDFTVDGNRVTIYRQPGSGKLYASRYHQNGQQTLPDRFPWKKMNSSRRFERVKLNGIPGSGALLEWKKMQK